MEQARKLEYRAPLYHPSSLCGPGEKVRASLITEAAVMRTRSILLSVLIVTLEIVSARAKPCQSRELLARMAELPPFIVVPAGSTPDDALARALDCSHPPPPTFAGGEPVDLKGIIGQQVFTDSGKAIGNIAGVAVDPNNAETKSLVRMSYGTGTANAAVPFQTLSLDSKTKEIFIENFNEGDLDKRWPVGSNTERLGKDAVVAVSACFMCPYPSMFPIDITSDPSGGTFFIAGQQQGSTELHGVITETVEQTIRIEYPKRKSCTFANGTYKSPQATGLGYATFFCKLAP
jgi:hypothetical protein